MFFIKVTNLKCFFSSACDSIQIISVTYNISQYLIHNFVYLVFVFVFIHAIPSTNRFVGLASLYYIYHHCLHIFNWTLVPLTQVCQDL